MKLVGLENVTANLNKVIAETGAKAKSAVMDVALDLQSKAANRAPLRYGQLRASAIVEDRGEVVRISFTEEYALRMHEDLEYRPSTPGTGPKYLSGPLQENETRYAQYIRTKAKL